MKRHKKERLVTVVEALVNISPARAESFNAFDSSHDAWAEYCLYTDRDNELIDENFSIVKKKMGKHFGISGEVVELIFFGYMGVIEKEFIQDRILDYLNTKGVLVEITARIRE